MKSRLCRNWGFWCGLGLCEVPFLTTILLIPSTSRPETYFIIIAGLAIFLFYSIVERHKLSNQLELEKREGIINAKEHKIKEYLQRQINNRLACVEVLKNLNNDQRLRSNIFYYNNDEEKYFMKYGHNMDQFDDKSIRIPDNLGCTGRAWFEQRQIFASRREFLLEGSHRVPPEEALKVPDDLMWICSTPILFGDETFRAVLNFDGNLEMSEEDQRGQIKSHAQRVASELAGDLELLVE